MPHVKEPVATSFPLGSTRSNPSLQVIAWELPSTSSSPAFTPVIAPFWIAGAMQVAGEHCPVVWVKVPWNTGGFC